MPSEPKSDRSMRIFCYVLKRRARHATAAESQAVIVMMRIFLHFVYSSIPFVYSLILYYPICFLSHLYV